MEILKTIFGAGGTFSRPNQQPFEPLPQTADDLFRIITNDIERRYNDRRLTPDVKRYHETNKAAAVQRFIELGGTQQQILDLIEKCVVKDELEYCQLLIPHLVNPLLTFQSIDIFATDPTPNRLQIVNTFIDRGVDVNAIIDDQIGYSLLHIAADAIDRRTQNYDFLKLLIDRGANINAQTNAQTDYAYTPLHIVAKSGYDIVVKFLIDNGADLNIQDNEGNTPLMLACKKKKTVTIAVLIDSGSNIDLTNNSGYSVKNDKLYKQYLENKRKATDTNVDNLTLALSGKRDKHNRLAGLNKEASTMMALYLQDPTGISDSAIRNREHNLMNKEDAKRKTKKGGKQKSRKQKSYRHRK